jgi:isocitrate/isopropylmalate dehydrogenase
LSVDILSTRLYLSVISDGAGNITGSLGSLGSRTLSQITTTGGPTTSGGSTQALIDIHVANSASGTSSLTANFYDAIYYAL